MLPKVTHFATPNTLNNFHVKVIISFDSLPNNISIKLLFRNKMFPGFWKKIIKTIATTTKYLMTSIEILGG